MFYRKVEVTLTLNSGRQITFKCKAFEITKNGNKLVGYTADGIDKRDGDPIMYVKLDSIDHIAFRKVFW